MLRLSLTQAVAGMELAESVYHPHHATVVLLKSGHVLDEHTIKRLRELHVGEVWIRYPRLDCLRRLVSQDVVAACREMSQRVARALDAAIVDRHARLDYHAYRQAVTLVIDALAASPAAGVYIMDAAQQGSHAMRHGANTCFLSILMGLKLDFYLIDQRDRLRSSQARDITPLGVGAMVHDIGLSRLPREVLDRFRASGDEGDPDWREHVRIGFEMVRGEFDPAASAVVLHHHQAYDGTGFPSKTEFSGDVHTLAGEEIHIFARIAAAAEQLCRLRFVDGGPPLPTVRALKAMLGPGRRERLDPFVLRALLAVVPAYAPGSIVRLSSGEQGVVVDWSPEDPCRPTVELIDDLASALVRDVPTVERVDLRKSRDLCIAEIDGVDVRDDNFYPSYAGEFDLARAVRAFMNRAEDDLAEEAERSGPRRKPRVVLRTKPEAA